MKYKNIKSVAHNIGHSFLSDTNAAMKESRYTIVPEELFARAARTQVPEVKIDLLTGDMEPNELRTPELEQAIQHFVRWLPSMLTSQNVAPEAVRSATLKLAFDYGRVRESKYHPERSVQEFVCTVEFTDDRGVVHRAHPDHWWMV